MSYSRNRPTRDGLQFYGIYELNMTKKMYVMISFKLLDQLEPIKYSCIRHSDAHVVCDRVML